MIEVVNLEKFYAKTKVLKNINLNIKNGEFVVLLGASGSGKSTLLKILSARESFDSGSVKISDEIYKHKVTMDKSRQILTQNYSLMPWLSALGNVEFALKCAGFSTLERQNHAKEFLELVGLKHRLHAHPHALSGGECQRVAIARALALKPKVLFMDEPFSALDPIIRMSLQIELKRLSRGVSVVFVTHDIDEAMLVADKIVVLKDGEIVFSEQNPSYEAYSQEAIAYKSRLLKVLLGEKQKLEYII
ncbi:ABC transporter ATP-binding protein [Campylobacter geochelonis]|uniref:ABC transporter ATP-binding protein n=1 Tax=Campylobacter geochelonis TaxID=1780362 RepID=UPI000770A93D|nr:ABC transporter ATP-binding protein [Campylobacter geochelonis]CZE49177.1 putative ABC transporter ATP-binding protein [Campylobacter geochelonis]CZE51568.1 putative ABC transporter ATP-binding protein [Campylobacter geochelonis]